MTVYHWLSIALSVLALALLLVGGFVAMRRRLRVRSSAKESWLTDQMIQQIIEVGALSDRQVPEEALNMEEIAREEERFWSETWDEPEHYWE
ncbi:MAG: hypothetical protein V3U13_03785 [Gemmatimonadota bacterium]|jgi:heme exporter protein D